MLRKQLEYVIGAAKECCHFFFNWDEFVINQVLLSILLVLMFSKSIAVALVAGIAGTIADIKEMAAHAREQYQQGNLHLRLASRDRDNA